MININKFKITERPECSADTKLFFDDVYKSSTQGKKQQVDVLQYGRSMIEMLGVLAIVGVLSVGGIAGYSKAMMKFKINKTIDQISHTIANIQTLYAQQTTYEGLDLIVNNRKYDLIKTIFTNIDFSNSDTPIPNNPFNGIYEIETYNNGNPGFLFKLGLNGLPKEACIALATQDWGSVLSSSVVGVAVGKGNSISQVYDYENITLGCSGTTELYNGYGACADSLPIPVATAAQYCNSDEDLHVFKITIKK